jgi:surfactin synthase thioesterase subunit
VTTAGGLSVRSRPAGGYLTREPDPRARMWLLCLHHAGGAASAFHDWQARLGPDVCVLPVQLPGREARVRETRVRRMRVLVERLDDALEPYLSEDSAPPFAVYGHSMGGLVGFRLAQRRAARGARLPVRLMVGAHPAPHRPHRLHRVPDLPRQQLVDLLTDIGGLPPELLRHPEWLDHALALIRDDLRVCADDAHDQRAQEPLPCPIDVFAGRDDPLLPVAEAAAWAQHTSAACVVHAVRGGHFFTHDPSGSEFFRQLAGVLDRVRHTARFASVPAFAPASGFPEYSGYPGYPGFPASDERTVS